ncbi:anhydro-N-acetylmuramic acid kinase [Thalassotalea euphylliae]|uniref:anhydro-N-acetylmuramic acid kinase n=1 Tax=Thalassotalea euphylliae TaxID=1655234 RepID=UPI003636CA1F
MATKANYFIGLMSGTSADGIDAALVDFSADNHSDRQHQCKLVHSLFIPFDAETRREITSLYQPNSDEIQRSQTLDKKLATLYADAVHQLLEVSGVAKKDIVAIGNHGQTIRHFPPERERKLPYTLQIGCNQTLAVLTGIEVIGQFRVKDIALGGQGAPLAPAFHQFLLGEQTPSVVLNLGGIANITYLTKDRVMGFDTGPANGLMDAWFAKHHSHGNYDCDGKWASSGSVITPLLDTLCAEPYFQGPPPKSTGREVFHLDWLSGFVNLGQYAPADIQATLLALTARTITDAINSLPSVDAIWLCGGGRHNSFLIETLCKMMPAKRIANIDQLGIDGDALEAMAFAYLAFAYKNNFCSNIPAVTGAKKSTTLGVLFLP